MAVDSTSPAGIVTGAASGIGAAVVEQLLAAGASVAAWDLAADRSPDATGRRFDQCVDVCDADRVGEAVSAAAERFGRLDYVVNCAGIYLVASLAEATARDVRRLFDVNVLGTTIVTQAALPHLEAARGSVVNVASTVATKPTMSNAHYAASKAAVAQLTRCWALELGHRGVRVNAVSPGPTRTNIYASAGMDERAVENLLGTRTAQIPLGRAGTPDEVARWICRLAVADEWVTGEVIAVDGGLAVT